MGLYVFTVPEPLARRGSSEVKITRHKMVFASASSGEYSFCTRVFSAKGRTSPLSASRLAGVRQAKTDGDIQTKKSRNDEI